MNDIFSKAVIREERVEKVQLRKQKALKCNLLRRLLKRMFKILSCYPAPVIGYFLGKQGLQSL